MMAEILSAVRQQPPPGDGSTTSVAVREQAASWAEAAAAWAWRCACLTPGGVLKLLGPHAKEEIVNDFTFLCQDEAVSSEWCFDACDIRDGQAMGGGRGPRCGCLHFILGSRLLQIALQI